MASRSGGADDRVAGIHQLVAEWVHRSPEAVAVRDRDRCLTYAELDLAARRLAGRLRRHGIAADEPVVIDLPRSADFVIAALGTLYAGGCYLPDDPEYPQQRQALIISQARPRWAVTTAERMEPLRASGVEPLLLDTPDEDEAPLAELPVAPESLAYIIYTSGSTGVPKGVAVSHRDVLNLITTDDRLAIAPGEMVAQLAPTAFDASTYEIWCALGRGGQVVVLGHHGFSIEALGAELRDVRPQWIFLTTGLFHLLVDFDPKALADVDHVITGGDVLSVRQVRAAAETGREVWAAYGPTENTVFCSLHKVNPDRAYERVPLGEPLASKRMYVLDAAQQVVADGEVGEIYVGGGGVARGYYQQPRTTAERFVPDPYSGIPGGRLYRTGDLGRRLPDGEFEFLGRIDRQVKIRGFRVELGEIEAQLSAHEAVTGAAALAVADGTGAKRLVAYASVAADTGVTGADLRAWLAERLPEFLRPSYYVVLDSLPVDPNGKIDRTALPAPWTSRDELDLPSYEPPATPAEELIAGLLAEALGLDRVGREDDFFRLGGDSLRSVVVLERLREEGVSLTAREFFRNPRAMDLADVAERAGWDSGGSAPAPEPVPAAAGVGE